MADTFGREIPTALEFSDYIREFFSAAKKTWIHTKDPNRDSKISFKIGLLEEIIDIAEATISVAEDEPGHGVLIAMAEKTVRDAKEKIQEFEDDEKKSDKEKAFLDTVSGATRNRYRNANQWRGD